MRNLTLRQAAEYVSHIEIECRRCGRAGRYPMKTAMERWGPDCDLWDIVQDLSWDCSQRAPGTRVTELCQAASPTYLKVPEK
ncbi:hypothetical protein HLH33_00480 [Gluconacetobacter diazotrophicus]|uniref:Uncharacterized protein n=1 Tax=Gluconacetobacter diazotrophicus TaxID=33996 RepID=A0A7W4FBQ3_GLUDI|nr:hypothetical protein [Gluconacetobacter diazotrophicus]